jgi:hypothetical protein
MDKAEFLRQEYVALRKEARAIRRRTFLLSLAALFPAPLLLALSAALDSLPLRLLVPPALLSLSLLHLAEGLSLARCGRYVKVYIEHGIEGVVGWEHWLETRDITDPRNADRLPGYVVQGFLLLQYLLSSALAVEAAWRRLVLPAAAACAAFYFLLGAGGLFLLARNLRRSATTGGEDVCLKALLIRPHCIFGPERD